MRVLLTGAHGFLGWHTRVRLQALTDMDVVPMSRDNWSRLPELVRGVDAVLHIAGVNRGAAEDVEQGNIRLAIDLVDAIERSGEWPRVVFANSIQSGKDSPYGIGKAAAASTLGAAARRANGAFVNVLLPNLFGEHGRPHYNSFVATFVDAVIRGEVPAIVDRQVPLLHVQEAAAALLGALRAGSGDLAPEPAMTSVQAVHDTLRCFMSIYRRGDIPSLTSPLDAALFNTLRAGLFPDHYPVALTVHEDERGRLVETVRSHGGQGQTFVSTTKPGITRGEHFHLAKVERFVVLAGEARISLRKLFTDQVISFYVDGAHPVIVDMPTMWAHNITNTGGSELTTMFWTDTLFDPDDPDTFPEPVGIERNPR